MKRAWASGRARLRQARARCSVVVEVVEAYSLGQRAATLLGSSNPSPAGGGLPPHITVLHPFVRRWRVNRFLIRRLQATSRRALADLGPEPLTVRLNGLERFPAVLYAVPEPAEPFARLTRALWAAWPRYPPYEGAFSTIVPHLSVVDGYDPSESVVAQLSEALPITAQVTEALLVAPLPNGRWETLARLPLGAINPSPSSGARLAACEP